MWIKDLMSSYKTFCFCFFFPFCEVKPATKIFRVDQYGLIRFGKRASTGTMSSPPPHPHPVVFFKNNSCIDPHWENPFIYFLLCTHLYITIYNIISLYLYFQQKFFPQKQLNGLKKKRKKKEEPKMKSKKRKITIKGQFGTLSWEHTASVNRQFIGIHVLIFFSLPRWESKHSSTYLAPRMLVEWNYRITAYS